MGELPWVENPPKGAGLEHWPPREPTPGLGGFASLGCLHCGESAAPLMIAGAGVFVESPPRTMLRCAPQLGQLGAMLRR